MQFLLKNCSEELTPSTGYLFNLFNISLATGIVPSHWKTTNVIPIHKKGDVHDIKNNRLISLLPIIGKVFERCVHTYIYDISEQDIFKNQHGFVTDKSITNQMVEYYNKVNSDSNIQTDIIFLDFFKAMILYHIIC